MKPRGIPAVVHPGLRASFAALLVTAGLAGALPNVAQQADLWQPVAQALGRSGEEAAGVYRVTFPRTDLRVRVGGTAIRPALALTSWAAFQKTGAGSMVMGDLVMQVSELAVVESILAEGGIEITAVHNHLAGEQPRVMYLHFHGHGEAPQLAKTLRQALALTGTPLGTPPARAAVETSAPDAEQLSAILGRKGTVRGGVVSLSIPRAETIIAGEVSLGPRMGVATAINFQAEGSGSVTTGDFVLVEKEVQPVIRALRAHGIEITALHNHVLDEQPRLFFLHFWSRGETGKLAQGLRAALDLTNHAK